MGVEKFSYQPARDSKKYARSEIRRRYRTKFSEQGFPTLRVRENEVVIEFRYGGSCDTDDGGAYLILSANTMAAVDSSSRGKILQWAARWTPKVSKVEVERIADRALQNPRWFRADSAGRLIRLTDAERQQLGITTIGAVDFPRDKRAQRRLIKAREQKHEKRRAAGVVPRAEWLAKSKEREKPWVAAGVSRATHFRKLRAKRETSQSP